MFPLPQSIGVLIRSFLWRCPSVSARSAYVDPANDGAEVVNGVADRVRAELVRNMGISDGPSSNFGQLTIVGVIQLECVFQNIRGN